MKYFSARISESARGGAERALLIFPDKHLGLQELGSPGVPINGKT